MERAQCEAGLFLCRCEPESCATRDSPRVSLLAQLRSSQSEDEALALCDHTRCQRPPEQRADLVRVHRCACSDYVGHAAWIQGRDVCRDPGVERGLWSRAECAGANRGIGQDGVEKLNL